MTDFIPSLPLILERLPLIFPVGVEYRNFVVREMAARTIYVMFYAGAVNGSDRWIRPSQVTDMTMNQAELIDDESRAQWSRSSLSTKKIRSVDSWYAPNSREPVRDETLRTGLIPYRAVLEREGIPTTSSKPKYCLDLEFAKLFDPTLALEKLHELVKEWQEKHLSKAAISRMRLIQHGASVARDAVTVTFPNGEVRALKPGPSSVVAKAVIEIYAPTFLKVPAVLWLSESGNKVVARDEQLVDLLKLKIDPSRALPDMILIDLGLDPGGGDMVVLFVENVASDGPINNTRKVALTAIAVEAGFDLSQLAFLTAFEDRSHPAFKKSVSELAWGTTAWCLSEPNNVLEFRDGINVE